MRRFYTDGVRNDGGFTLLEVMIAGVIMGIGLMALAWGFTSGFATVQTAQEDTIARQAARETLEGILSARNNATITYDKIDNVGTGNGIFVVGWQALKTEGADGIIGTADDGPGIESVTLPGPDGVLGTADDVTVALNNYQRLIVVTDSATNNANVKQITVTIKYTTPPGQTRQVSVSTYVSPYI